MQSSGGLVQHQRSKNNSRQRPAQKNGAAKKAASAPSTRKPRRAAADGRRHVCPACISVAWACIKTDQSFSGIAFRSNRGTSELSGCIGLSYMSVRRLLSAALPRCCSLNETFDDKTLLSWIHGRACAPICCESRDASVQRFVPVKPVEFKSALLAFPLHFPI